MSQRLLVGTFLSRQPFFSFTSSFATSPLACRYTQYAFPRPVSLQIARSSSAYWYRRMASAAAKPKGPVETAIEKKLTDKFHPTQLRIQNDSAKHAHHAPMKAIGGGSGETHFTVEIVSEAFKGQRSIQRHRLVNAELKEEFDQGLHALSIITKAPEEV